MNRKLSLKRFDYTYNSLDALSSIQEDWRKDIDSLRQGFQALEAYVGVAIQELESRVEELKGQLDGLRF